MVRTHDDFIVFHYWETRPLASSLNIKLSQIILTMSQPHPILIMPRARLGSDKYQFLSHQFGFILGWAGCMIKGCLSKSCNYSKLLRNLTNFFDKHFDSCEYNFPVCPDTAMFLVI